MKIKVVNQNSKMKTFIEWLIYMFGYSLTLYIISLLFDSFQLDTSCFGIYIFLTTIIIYFLNHLIKPALIYFTLPVTALTLGLFYPFVNVVILKITDLILGKHFNITDLFTAFFIAIFISLLNIFIEGFIVKPIIRKLRK